MAAGKKAQNDREAFKLVLSLKHVVMTGLGLTVTLVWIFVLGVLVGKGEVGRLLTGWGLLRAAAPVRTGIPAVPPPPEAHPEAAAPAAPQAATPSPDPGGPAVTTKPAPVASAVVPAPAPEKTATAPTSPPKEKAAKSSKATKTVDKAKTPAAKEKTEKESLAAKLKFQNSFAGTSGKAVKGKTKATPPVQAASVVGAPSAAASPAAKVAVAKPKGYRVKIGAYRSQKEAQQAVEELKKKGVPVSLAAGKDKKGAVYVVRTGKVKTKAEAEKFTKKLQGSRYQGTVEETP